MPLLAKRPFADSILPLKTVNEAPLIKNHIFEPEFHQDIYRNAGELARVTKGAFRLSDSKIVESAPNRGTQPLYADDESNPESLIFKGKMRTDGSYVNETETTNICALKSNAVRWGYVDFEVARSVDADFYIKNAKRAGVQRYDILINSTGDGTIGRVAIYNRVHPALVDGHITIVRLRNKQLAWHVAAYLLSTQGQRQIYRFVNGSSGQVEIYPQDIERIWIPGISEESAKSIAKSYAAAVKKFEDFQSELAKVLGM